MPPERSRLSVLHRDEHLVVVSKPAGMLSVAGAADTELSVPRALERQGIRALPVHRLDREVSGAMILALDEKTRADLEEMFRERAVEKTYWAMARGRVRPAQGDLRFPILEQASFARVSARGKPSSTRYRTLENLPETTVLEIDLVTGRYNQIRVHLAHAGYPLIGERKYARGSDSPVRIKSRRVALHSWRLAFSHPRSSEKIAVVDPLPEDLLDLLARAGRAK